MSSDDPIDNVWQIYTQIIDETIGAAAHLQSAAVLDKIKRRWLAHLTDRVARQSVAQPPTPPVSAVPAETEDGGASRVPAGRLVKVKATADAQDRPVRSAPTDSTATTGTSRFSDAILHEPTVMKSLIWGPKKEEIDDNNHSAAVVVGTTRPDQVDGSMMVPPMLDFEGPTIKKSEINTNKNENRTNDAENDDDDDEDDDNEWGDWEDSSCAVVNVTDGEPASVPAGRDPAATPDVCADGGGSMGTEEICSGSVKEGGVDEQGRYVPSQADFSTRIVTQYGRTNLSDLSSIATTALRPADGNASATMGSPKPALMHDPDAVSSDLDDVEDLSDEELEARDTIVAQFESLIKPGTKKIHSQGIWRIKARNGVAHIGGREFFFESLYANLDFRN